MAGYGGSTSCVVISRKNSSGLCVPLVIDAGNGAIAAGRDIAAGIKAGTTSSDFTMLWTHVHWDHVEGIPFFSPFFMPNANIFLGGLEKGRYHLSKALPMIMATPFFPVKFENLPSKRTFFHAESTFFINQKGEPVTKAANGANPDGMLLRIDCFQGSARFHPDPGCIYYRITDCEDGASAACIWDIETTVTDDAGRAEYEALVNFIKGSNLLIHDTMYTAEEYASTTAPVKGYGHSTYDMAIETARRAGVKKTAAFHYNPAHTDTFLKTLAQIYRGKLLLVKQGDCIQCKKSLRN
jgi:phosphoribosyl 1,2-cyclic phosphodiesterase